MVISYRALTPSKERQSSGFHRNQLLALASFLTAFVLLASLLSGCDPSLQAGPSARYAVASQQGKAGLSDEGTGRKKVASGEYLVYEEASEGAVGPLGEKVYDFHESWTLWQTGKGEYEVEGDRRFNTSADLLRSFRFVVRLSRDFTVLRVTEFATLKWISDSGPLTCEFLPKELHCSPGGKNPRPSTDWHISVEHPYGLLWPISPFSLGSVARESERDLARPTQASLIEIEQPSADNPISPAILTGELRYLGIESIEEAGQNWQAYKFSLKVPLHPKFLIWTSSKGLLLALAVEHSHPNWPKEGIKLVRFEKSADL